VCFAFAGKMCGKEDESAQFASYFCSIFGEKRKKKGVTKIAQFSGRKKGVTKISRTLVREGICRRSESLFSLIYGCVLVVGFKQKKWCYDF
jgi:hypothetical protein